MASVEVVINPKSSTLWPFNTDTQTLNYSRPPAAIHCSQSPTGQSDSQ